MHDTKKNWYVGALLFALTLFFVFGWMAVYQIIAVPQVNGSWLLPIVWFSLGISSLCLLAFSSKEATLLGAGSLIAFVPAVFFVHDMRFILVLFLGAGLVFSGLSRMRYALGLNMRIYVRRSMHHGIGLLVFAFSFAITAFYFLQIQNKSGDELLQKLSIDQASHAMLTRSLGMINPEFKKANQENVTVDQFIMTMQKDQPMGDFGMGIPSDEELLQMAGMKPTDPRAPQVLTQIKKGLAENSAGIDPQKLILEQGRKQLSDIVGKPLSGQEPIADVFSQVIDQRVRTYFQPNMVGGDTTVLPFVLSVILFLTLWSLGAFLAILWRFMTAGAFTLLRRFRIIEVKKVMVEQEVIE